MATTASLPPHQITGLILAGGRATRMGGVDKGLQLFRGTPLVSHVLQRLAPQVGPLLISANRNLGAYAALGYPVVTDEQLDLGPLGGILAGLKQCTTEYLLTAPCDCPFLPFDLGTRLGTALIQQAADVAVACTDRGVEPLFCLLRRSVMLDLQTYLLGGGRKADGWYTHLRSVKVDYSGETEAFANINSIDDLRRFDR